MTVVSVCAGALVVAVLANELDIPAGRTAPASVSRSVQRLPVALSTDDCIPLPVVSRIGGGLRAACRDTDATVRCIEVSEYKSPASKAVLDGRGLHGLLYRCDGVSEGLDPSVKVNPPRPERYALPAGASDGAIPPRVEKHTGQAGRGRSRLSSGARRHSPEASCGSSTPLRSTRGPSAGFPLERERNQHEGIQSWSLCLCLLW